MTPREKNLVFAIGGLVILIGLARGISSYRAELQRRTSNQTTAEQALSQARTAVARGQRAEKRLLDWRKQALPTNLDVAKSLYHDWLRSELNAAGLQTKQLTATVSQRQSNRFKQVSYTAEATGTLPQWATFLHRFYEAEHLHRISRTSLTPTEDRKQLTISMSVDAVSLPEGDRTNKLATDDDIQELPPLYEYLDPITARNVFATLDSDNGPAQVEEKSTDDESKEAKITRMAYGRNGWQMSVRKKDGSVVLFRVGESISIGDFAGTLLELDGRRAVVKTASGQVEVFLGQTLGNSRPLPLSASNELL